MELAENEPKVNCLKDLKYFSRFLELGQKEFCNFLKNFLNLDQIRIQVCEINVLKTWLKVDSLEEAMEVPGDDNEVCVVSQIKANGELIAYFPYVIRGRDVKRYLTTMSFLPKLSEAISNQISLCYLHDFRGGDWIFGENLAKIIVSNCISTRKYDGIKFFHLIEKMEQLAATTFEGEFFPTGVIVSADSSKYKSNYFEFRIKRNIDNLAKREWFLANGQESFFLLDSNTNTGGIYRKSIPASVDFISRYFDEYYLNP